MLKNMKIGKKLIVTFLLVAFISSISGVLGLIVMTGMNSTYSNALVNYGFSQGEIGLFSTEFNNSRALVRTIMGSFDTNAMNASINQLTSSDIKLDTYFTNMKKGMTTKQELSIYNDIKDSLTKYSEVSSQIIALMQENKHAEGNQLASESAVPISNRIRASTDALIRDKTTAGNQIEKTLTAQAATTNIGILIVILGSLILSFMIALKISKSISKPVTEMADAAKRMADGDLSVQITVDNSKNEIAQLSAAFSETIATLKAYIADIAVGLEQMAKGNLNVGAKVEFKGDFKQLQYSIDGIVISFNDALTQIRQSSEQVSAGSEQVSSGAQALAQGATEQASSVEELSATISEISTEVKQNAEHATNASVNASRVSSEIQISNGYMSKMVTAMSQINDSSNQIGEIIKTIEDIAFQTNILALNAAVEAARAGSAGKGFAVVADEVRNLASKSAEAAKDVTVLVENSVRQVENGTKIADETSISFLQVVESVKVVADTIEKISEASIRQSDAIGQVTLGVEQISGVVQTNSATAEESSAASEELSGQAQILKEIVKKFKLRNETDQTNSDSETQNIQDEPFQLEPEEIYSDSNVTLLN